MKYYVTGDTHGKVFERLEKLDSNPSETALIILGDAGLNFCLNKTDNKEKQKVQDSGFTVYCVRGNHEERPRNIEGMEVMVDHEIDGLIEFQPQFPNIRYLIDGEEYTFNGHSALVIGGAYSVDKFYRLQRARKDGWSGWFKDEQLSADEMLDIAFAQEGRQYDFVLTHTCPFDWRPTDLFLPFLDQSTVDNTMELWMQEFKDKIDWKVWLFGHYHDDRLVRPRVEMFFKDIEDLEVIYDRWDKGQVDWWLKKDPNYYIDGDTK